MSERVHLYYKVTKSGPDAINDTLVYCARDKQWIKGREVAVAFHNKKNAMQFFTALVLEGGYNRKNLLVQNTKKVPEEQYSSILQQKRQPSKATLTVASSPVEEETVVEYDVEDDGE